MPTLEENLQLWGRDYAWIAGGEEWSEPWGASHAQWTEAILPRIARFLPTGSILEIGPGYGRWTHYLREQCQTLDVVDLSDRCIRACSERFTNDDRVRCHVNDGRSLSMIENSSIDLVFSFDSLVHVEADVIALYLHEVANKLAPDGVGFIHHSNAGAYSRYFGAIGRLRRMIPPSIVDTAERLGLVDTLQFRALSMTVEQFAESCKAAGLQCIGQEAINWKTKRLIDCVSTFTTASSRWASANQLLLNHRFMAEARAIKHRSIPANSRPEFWSAERANLPSATPMDERRFESLLDQVRGLHRLADEVTREEALADLHQRGVLTDEEFQAAKARLLG